ncbi:hypothetical protein EJ03DRAFT_323009 [Teratosphaeria nubilosa]|uniref:Uncharacterized protein n=1 Tax=Teratosphaeria nubilosa TaxID=161662 RepID=A0A6G1LNM1_9PEZI|nr:hypothetical protein EJ03DRAFT_323009 [Teratosphaeria nubilosa]
MFGILSGVVAVPAIVGTTEAIREGQKRNQREEHRGRKYHLAVTLLRRSPKRSAQFDNALIVLSDNKLYVDTREPSPTNERFHPVTGYYIRYTHGDVEEQWKVLGYHRGEGYVTTINDQNYLNWVYVDRKTHEVKYGIRAEAETEKVGPWDCTKVERRLTFEGWEGFIAVQEQPDSPLWALYFDCADDGLAAPDQPGSQGKPMLELQVWRKEPEIERYDAVAERFERLQLREEHAKQSEAKAVDLGAEAAEAAEKGDFEGRLEIQRDLAQSTHGVDFETKMRQQREIGENMFGKK